MDIRDYARAVWDALPALHHEFGTFDHFMAFERARFRGSVGARSNGSTRHAGCVGFFILKRAA